MVTDSTEPGLALAFCSAQYEDAAINELARLLDARLDRRLAPEVLLPRVPGSPAESRARVDATPPIFSRQPVVGIARVALSGQAGPIGSANQSGDLVIHDLEGRPVSTWRRVHDLEASPWVAHRHSAPGHGYPGRSVRRGSGPLPLVQSQRSDRIYALNRKI